MVRFVMPLLCIRLIVVLHQRAEEDDEDDLQDEADDRQLQPHVGCRVRHVFFPVRGGGEDQRGSTGFKDPAQKVGHTLSLSHTPGGVLSAETGGWSVCRCVCEGEGSSSQTDTGAGLSCVFIVLLGHTYRTRLPHE